MSLVVNVPLFSLFSLIKSSEWHLTPTVYICRPENLRRATRCDTSSFFFFFCSHTLHTFVNGPCYTSENQLQIEHYCHCSVIIVLFLTTWIVFHLSLRYWQESFCDNQCEILFLCVYIWQQSLVMSISEISFLKIHAVYLCVYVHAHVCVCVFLLQRYMWRLTKIFFNLTCSNHASIFTSDSSFMRLP